MISFRVADCDIDVIPFIKGLVSEKHKVIDALNNIDYDATGVALGFEDVEAIRRRKEIVGDFQPSELDEVYGFILKNFGPVDVPDPACTALIDICTERKIPVNPLDMNDEDYSKLYCDTVSTLEFLRENRVIKKAMRYNFNKEDPVSFVFQWDNLVNEIKGYRKMSQYREMYMAEQINKLAMYRKRVLLLIERERIAGTLKEWYKP